MSCDFGCSMEMRMGTVIRVDDRARSFADTIKAAVDGEYWALEMLATECLPKLTSFAEARGANDPDGIANTVMMEFFQRLDTLSFEAPPQLWAYLYRIARSRVIDERRSTKPVEYREEQAMEGLGVPVGDVGDEVAERHYVNELLAELTSDQREVLEMRFLDDLSIEETANRTGRTLTAVKGLQRRAIRAISTAAAIIVLLLLAGAAWALFSSDPSITAVSDPASDSDGEGGRSGQGAEEEIGAGVLVVPGDDLAPSSSITNVIVDEEDRRQVSFEFGAEDELSGVARFECRLDGGEYEACTSPVKFKNLAEGSHVFEVRSVDRAYNVERNSATHVWTVSIDRPAGAVPGVDVAALRRSNAELKCAGVSGTWVQLEEEGYDVMVGTEGDDVIDVSGGNKPDFVLSYEGNDNVRTGNGDDVVCTGDGNDSIETNSGSDRIAAGSGNDTIMAGGHHDRVWAGGGNDSVWAGGGNDLVKGEAGTDSLLGGAGHDTLVGGEDIDVIVGGDDNDTCEPDVDGGPETQECEKVPEEEPSS